MKMGHIVIWDPVGISRGSTAVMGHYDVIGKIFEKNDFQLKRRL